MWPSVSLIRSYEKRSGKVLWEGHSHLNQTWVPYSVPPAIPGTWNASWTEILHIFRDNFFSLTTEKLLPETKARVGNEERKVSCHTRKQNTQVTWILTVPGVMQVTACWQSFPVSRHTGILTHQWHVGDGEVSWLPSDLDWKIRFEGRFIKAGKGHSGCGGFKVRRCQYSKIVGSEIKVQHKAPGTLKEMCVWFLIPRDTIRLWISLLKKKIFHRTKVIIN